MSTKAPSLKEKRLRREAQQNIRLEAALRVKRETNHRIWRCKEMLDLLGDVLLAGEMNPDEIESLYLQLGFLIEYIDVPSRLSPGRREVLGKAIVTECRKAKKKDRIKRINKGEI